VKLLQFIAALAAKAGLDTDNANLVKLLQESGLDIDIDKEISDAINNNLMDFEGAKNNMDVKNYHVGEFNRGFDDNFFKNIKKLDLPQEIMDKLQNEKSSGKRTNLALAEIYNYAKNKYSTASNDDAIETMKADHEKVLNDLKSTHSGELEGLRTQSANDLSAKDSRIHNLVLQNKLSSYPWKDEYSADFRGELGSLAVQKKLNELGGVMIIDDNNQIKLMQSKDNSMALMKPDQTPWTATDFFDDVMANAKFIKVNDDPKPPNPGDPPTPKPGDPNPPKPSAMPLGFQEQMARAKEGLSQSQQ